MRRVDGCEIGDAAADSGLTEACQISADGRIDQIQRRIDIIVNAAAVSLAVIIGN